MNEEKRIYCTPVVTSGEHGEIEAVGAKDVDTKPGEHLVIGDVVATGNGNGGSVRATGIQGGTISPGAKVTIGRVEATGYKMTFGKK